MRFLLDNEEKQARIYFNKTIEIARNSTCLRSKCGTVIVKNGEIIGRGFNSPPGDLESQRRCLIKKNEYDLKVTDKTCCVHAEQRAIADALDRYNKEKLIDSTLYFARLDLEDNFLYAGDPYCTICSKFVLDAGIAEFALWHEQGICVYDTGEYNDISFGK